MSPKANQGRFYIEKGNITMKSIKKFLSVLLTLSLVFGIGWGIAPVKAYAEYRGTLVTIYYTYTNGTATMTANTQEVTVNRGDTFTILAYCHNNGGGANVKFSNDGGTSYTAFSISYDNNDYEPITCNQSTQDKPTNVYYFQFRAYDTGHPDTSNEGITITVNINCVEHNYDNGACTYCGAQEPAQPGPAPVNTNNRVSNTKEPEVQTPQAPPCEHNYEWRTITAATATADGEEAYMCTKCGDVKERRGLSAMGVFEVEFANKILKAGPGATVYIDCKPWNSFGWAIRDAMKKRPDVTIKASFLSEGHKGTPLKVTIPAARTDLFDNNGYLGLCRAGTALGYDQ